MKKTFCTLILLLTLTLMGCSTDEKNPFELVNNNDNFYIYVELDTEGVSYTTIREDFNEGDISYFVFKNSQDIGRKIYWDHRLSTSYRYDYYPENGYWIRSVGGNYSSTNEVDIWDIDNYDLDGNIYRLKDNIDAGDIYFSEIWYSEGKVYRVEKSYSRVSTYTFNMTWTFTYSRFGEEFNLKLPTSFQNG